MRAKDRARARTQLDKRLKILGKPDAFARPPRGWVKAIREALGMTADQLGRRMGVSRQRALELEASEARGAVTLESLERAAQALECHLVYTLVPRMPLDQLVHERAATLAAQQLRSAAHTMTLEDQSVDPADEVEQLRRLTQDLIDKSGSALWEAE
ncbi:MAG: mobile mystery protein A [Gammaproteobacteria bacterium]|nr:mobile mystery protein A [Gammaproteobacteria bacterium]MDH5262047.1 mobile mystery protein A [Gammaproteobacteria bacterium]